MQKNLENEGLTDGKTPVTFEEELMRIFNRNFKKIFNGDQAELLSVRLELGQELLKKEKGRLCSNLDNPQTLKKLRKIEMKIEEFENYSSSLYRISVNEYSKLIKSKGLLEILHKL